MKTIKSLDSTWGRETSMSTKVHTYYTRMRPPGPGCQPSNGLREVKDYDGRKAVNGGILAWGEVTYSRPLSEKEIRDYELTIAKSSS